MLSLSFIFFVIVVIVFAWLLTLLVDAIGIFNGKINQILKVLIIICAVISIARRLGVF